MGIQDRTQYVTVCKSQEQLSERSCYSTHIHKSAPSFVTPEAMLFIRQEVLVTELLEYSADKDEAYRSYNYTHTHSCTHLYHKYFINKNLFANFNDFS